MSGSKEYHWILTLTGSYGPERSQVTVGERGLLFRDPALTTREQVCNELVNRLRDAFLARTGMLLENYNITCFEFEPNQL